MNPTPYSDVNEVIDSLLTQMQAILQGKLVGVYLFGSLVMGDFDPDTSDIDLLIATTELINQTEFDALHRMQQALVAQRPEWDNRLELIYLSLHALKTFKTEASTIAITSPGEPFHFIQAGSDWLVNWYIVREKGITLYGPPPASIIEPVSFAEFVTVIKDHLTWWREWLNTSDQANRGSQAYAILTMCRALYLMQNREQASKLRAAQWAANEFPQWADLINRALIWRKFMWREENVDHAATVSETQRFVRFAIDHMLD